MTADPKDRRIALDDLQKEQIADMYQRLKGTQSLDLSLVIGMKSMIEQFPRALLLAKASAFREAQKHFEKERSECRTAWSYPEADAAMRAEKDILEACASWCEDRAAALEKEAL